MADGIQFNFFYYYSIHLCCIFRPVCHSTLFQAWETFLQETEADSQTAIDIASSLSRQVIGIQKYYNVEIDRHHYKRMGTTIQFANRKHTLDE